MSHVVQQIPLPHEGLLGLGVIGVEDAGEGDAGEVAAGVDREG